jgi:hypothetical protein
MARAEPKVLHPIGYVDDDGKFYRPEDVHPLPDDLHEWEVPRWLSVWARKQVDERYNR